MKIIKRLREEVVDSYILSKEDIHGGGISESGKDNIIEFLLDSGFKEDNASKEDNQKREDKSNTGVTFIGCWKRDGKEIAIVSYSSEKVYYIWWGSGNDLSEGPNFPLKPYMEIRISKDSFSMFSRLFSFDN